MVQHESAEQKLNLPLYDALCTRIDVVRHVLSNNAIPMNNVV